MPKLFSFLVFLFKILNEPLVLYCKSIFCHLFLHLTLQPKQTWIYQKNLTCYNTCVVTNNRVHSQLYTHFFHSYSSLLIFDNDLCRSVGQRNRRRQNATYCRRHYVHFFVIMYSTHYGTIVDPPHNISPCHPYVLIKHNYLFDYLCKWEAI